MLQIHPDPMLSPSVVKNALADPDLSFSIFHLPHFHHFRPCLVRFSCRFAYFAGKNVWIDPDLRFTISTFPSFIFSAPALVDPSLILNLKLKLARSAPLPCLHSHCVAY